MRFATTTENNCINKYFLKLCYKHKYDLQNQLQKNKRQMKISLFQLTKLTLGKT